MATGYYLLDHKNPNGPFYYTTRRNPLLAIVVHITAGLEDLDATDDHSAENTARYAATTTRPVSWHSGSDSDSAFNLLPASYTAFQVRGYNSCTYGHEISKRETDWRDDPEPWRTLTLTKAAKHLGRVSKLLGMPRRHISKAELDHALKVGSRKPLGFISHWQLDVARRTDPGYVNGVGDTFPWTEFFNLMDDKKDWFDMASKEDLKNVLRQDTPAFFARLPGDHPLHDNIYLCNVETATMVEVNNGRGFHKMLKYLRGLAGQDNTIHELSEGQLAGFIELTD